MKIPWECDPHTAAKHRVLERYLQAWWPIMLRTFPRATYVEGFAGPGVYVGGEPGSPIIALRTLAAASGPDKPVDLIFVDREPRCLTMLGDEINKNAPTLRAGSTVHLVGGNAGDEVLARLDAVRAWEGGVFAFLDSWGNVAVPIDVVRRLARRGSEVFVTLGRRFWSQFGKSVGSEWDAMFGTDEWRAVAEIRGAPAQAAFLKACYRRSLQQAGFTYVVDFELVDARGEHLYLIHGTTHQLGVERMKDALWKVDPVSGAGFRDPRGQLQGQQPLGLDWEPDLSPLRAMVSEWIADGAKSLEHLRRRTFEDTVYKQAHASRVVGEMVREGLLGREPTGGRLVGTTMIFRQ